MMNSLGSILLLAVLYGCSVLAAAGQRPHVVIAPQHPYLPIPSSPPRSRVCSVKSNGDGSDDSPNILKAIHSCNNGGHVVFSDSNKYIIGTALNLTFLQHIDLEIQGTIQFTNDTDYWQAHSFSQIFQNATTFFQLGGHDVNVYGGGTLDGNGQVWYDLYAQNDLILRPVLFGTIGLHGGMIADLNLRHSPQYYNFVANSSNVVFSGISIAGASTSKNEAKNTDGKPTSQPTPNCPIHPTNVPVQAGTPTAAPTSSFRTAQSTISTTASASNPTALKSWSRTCAATAATASPSDL